MAPTGYHPQQGQRTTESWVQLYLWFKGELEHQGANPSMFEKVKNLGEACV